MSVRFFCDFVLDTVDVALKINIMCDDILDITS